MGPFDSNIFCLIVHAVVFLCYIVRFYAASFIYSLLLVLFLFCSGNIIFISQINIQLQNIYAAYDSELNKLKILSVCYWKIWERQSILQNTKQVQCDILSFLFIIIKWLNKVCLHLTFNAYWLDSNAWRLN